MKSDLSGPSKRAKWGWGILLFVSALMLLNGVMWFFLGPNRMIAYYEETHAIPMADAYPSAAAHLTRSVRQVAIWYGVFGLMALLIGVRGFRQGSRWAWYASWMVPAALLAIGLNYLGGGPSFDNLGLLSVGALALVGQLMARPRTLSIGSSAPHGHEEGGSQG